MTPISCDLGHAVYRSAAVRAIPIAATVTSAWIMMLTTLTIAPTKN
jgi:hypothetical protein